MITYKSLGNFGRFGNQLFQLASTIGISILNHHDYCFPNWIYSKYFNSELPKFQNLNYIEILENNFSYEELYLDKNKNYNITGYRQSFKYFIHCKDIISNYLTLSKKYDNIFQNIDFQNSVSMHIRRTDYLKLKHIYNILDDNYYIKCLNMLDNINQVYIFSDDIEWCKNNIKFINNKVVFNNEVDILDMFLMSKFKYNIISNSTFSWWAAWLNKNNDKKIFVPSVWFVKNEEIKNFKYDDLIPEDWIKINIK